MVDIIPPQTVLTPSGAADDLQSHGLDALGLTVPNLSPVWSGSAPGSYDQAALTLQLTGLRAPFRGVLEYVAIPTTIHGLDGKALSGPIATMQLHPEAVRRLTKLVENRLGATPAVHPVPVLLAVRGVTVPNPVPVPNWFFAGDPVDGITGSVTISFHDARGLPICPVAVACLFRELLSFRPALYVKGSSATQAVGDTGGLDAIAGKASGVLVHVVDPHGWPYAATRDAAKLKVTDASNAAVSTVGDDTLVALAANQGLGRTTADDAADIDKPLRWGFATNGTLGRARLVPPTLTSGVTLARQFFRVMAVDLDWHLVGNRRTQDPVGIPPDDGKVPAFLLPAVRDPVPSFAYLTDAQDVAGAAGAMIASFGSQTAKLAYAVSPVLDERLAAPPQAGPTGHWPAFPAFAAPQPISTATNPRDGLTATRAAADASGVQRDVVVTIAAGKLPDGAHVRVFPRLFQQIAAIGADAPSFVRPDGAAAIAQAGGGATKLVLLDPFNLGDGAPWPVPANLAMDIVVTDRNGRRRLFSQTTVAVADGPETPADNLAQFGGNPLLGATGLKAALDADAGRSVAEAPLFGVPRSAPLPGLLTDPIGFLRAMAIDTQPRRGPRLPTMMRFESILATGTATAADTPLSWSAVLSGARFNLEARSSRADLGNPGNPAGPDVMAAGIRADGRLARDLATHAIKRAQSIVPLGSGTKGWVVETDGNEWNLPPTDTTGTVAAAMLETVAAIADTPELSVGIPDPTADEDLQGLLNRVTGALGTGSLPASVTNAAEIVRRVQREIVTAKYGQRDAQWSLRRAFGQAREFVYIESPAFARTARPGANPQPHEVDLIDVLQTQLSVYPGLKVVICTPRLPDFGTDKQGWVRTAFAHRKEAVLKLTGVAQTRVAAFHPIGFPGRPSPLRTTTIIVDDVYCLVGTSHFRRRGMTFDGAADIASIDKQIAGGYSAAIAKFRQALMAQRLGIAVPTAPDNASALWVRLARPESAFSVIAELLGEGGEGRLTPVWAGPTDTSVLPQTDAVADPDGADGATFQTFIAAALAGE